jgi:hypothetical protein
MAVQASVSFSLSLPMHIASASPLTNYVVQIVDDRLLSSEACKTSLSMCLYAMDD